MVMQAEVKKQLAPKKKEPKQKIDEKTKKWAKSFIEKPSQVELNKPDDYLRCLRRTATALVRKSTSATRRDVAQLGAQAKQSISPLKVLPTNQGLAAAYAAADFAAEAGISLSQVHGTYIPFLAEDTWKW